MDFSGVWQPIYQEDVPERLAGPALRDYVGLPINDSARQFADSWDPSRISLPEEQCRVHVSPYIYRGPTQLRIFEEKDPKTQQLLSIKHYISTYEQTRTIWMDNRPHPGPNARAHLDGFFDRPLRRRHARRRDHASQAGLDPAERPADERPRDDDRVLRAQRRPDDAHLRAHRSGLPDRAAGQESGFHAEHPRAGAAGAGSGCASRWWRLPIARRARCRRTCRTSIRSRTSSASSATCPKRPSAAAPRRCIPSFRRRSSKDARR